MIQTFKVDTKHQLKSISNGAKFLGFSPFILVGVLLYREVAIEFVLVFLLCYNLFFFLPALILHLIYYLENRKQKVVIDKDQQVVIIKSEKKEVIIKGSDLKQVVKVLSNDYRLPKWQQNWYLLPWREYGYLKLVTKENKVYILTSLMLDLHDSPLKETHVEYSYIPIINEAFKDETSPEELLSFQREIIAEFKLKFKSQTTDELKIKIIKKGYRKEAMIAAEELLNERNAIANKTHSA